MTEVDEKVERLARIAHAQGVEGILVSRQPTFAWLAAGASNRIDGSSEEGAGSLFVTRDGRRFVIANDIEMPRLQEEALAGAGFEPIAYPWTDDHRDPATPATLAQEVAGTGRIGSDAPLPGVTDLAGAVRGAQVPLTATEIERYRALGREAGASVGSALGELRPGLTELEIAAHVNAAAEGMGARPIVTLVGADDRLARFRHPVPTRATWHESVVVGLCLERAGLVVALSRVITSGEGSELGARTEAAARVFGALLHATRPGVTGAALFATAAAAYREAGYPGQEGLHHQGGAIGYRSRDWIAHPASSEVVHDRQGFAWNPSITGTKVEDTALLVDGGIEIITATPGWPAIEVQVGGRTLRAPGVHRL